MTLVEEIILTSKISYATFTKKGIKITLKTQVGKLEIFQMTTIHSKGCTKVKLQKKNQILRCELGSDFYFFLI